MDSELAAQPPELGDESQSSKLSSVNPSDMENGGILDPSSDSDSDSDSDNAGDESEAPPQVEWLAMGRQRRSTAGNRMKSMLANEEPDSDLELLFAEDENDQGFSDAGDNASDVQMDSSSDEDGGNADDDELEGEKELDRQAKERRAAQRKRKAQEAIPAKFRKKVRIDTSNSTPRSSVGPGTPQSATTTATQPRPKKKSERSSWLPSVADMPTRASSRQTTRLSKEQLHAQMEEREAKRLKQLAQMQKKAARLEALKKPPMTQEERLREAAIVEERNSKSLNRWEEAEKQREEERRAKLAALHERTLNGPVISFWSGMGKFGDGWRKGEGIHVAVEEKPKRAKKEKPAKGSKKDDAKDAAKKGPAGEIKAEGAANAAPAKPDGAVDATQVDPASDKKTEAKTDATNETPKQNDTAIATAAPKDAVMSDAPATEAKDGSTRPAPDTNGTDSSTVDAAKETAADVSMMDVSTNENIENPATNDAEAQPSEAVVPIEPSETGPTETASKVTETPAEPAAEKPVAEQPSAEASTAQKPPAETPPAATTSSAREPKKPEEAEKEPPAAAERQADGTNGAPSHATPGPSTAPATAITTDGKVAGQAPLPPADNESLPASKAVSQLHSEAATPQPEQDAQKKSPLDGLPATRSAIIYQNFDENAIKDKSVQTQVLFGRKMNRLPSTYQANNQKKQCR